MKTIFLFIFATIFSQTKAKVFLVALDKEKVKDLHDNSDIVEQDVEEEKANKNDKEADETGVHMAELKATHTVRDKTGHAYSVASDYSNTEAWAEVTFVDGGVWWECRYKTSRR